MAKITLNIETESDEIKNCINSFFSDVRDFNSKDEIENDSCDDKDEFEKDDDVFDRDDDEAEEDTADYDDDDFAADPEELYGRLYELEEELADTTLRLELVQLTSEEMVRRSQNMIVCLTCITAADDPKKNIVVDYNIGFVREYLVEFSCGNSTEKSELCITAKRNSGTGRDIIAGTIAGLPDHLVPGARVLLRVDTTKKKPKIVYERQIFPDPNDDVIRSLTERLSLLEEKYAELSDSGSAVE